MSEPTHISQVLPGVMAEIERRMDAAERRQREQERIDRQRRIVAAAGDYLQTRGKKVSR